MEQKVAELLKIIKQHNKSYRNGRPEVTDAVYDREVEMLRELDPDNSWFHRLEPAEVRARRKSTLPIPMKSLNKVKDIADFKGWLRNAGVNNGDEVESCRNSMAFPCSATKRLEKRGLAAVPRTKVRTAPNT
jgi:NAD-dependent DNA ligase (contains BRCT domain type II)